MALVRQFPRFHWAAMSAMALGLYQDASANTNHLDTVYRDLFPCHRYHWSCQWICKAWKGPPPTFKRVCGGWGYLEGVGWFFMLGVERERERGETSMGELSWRRHVATPHYIQLEGDEDAGSEVWRWTLKEQRNWRGGEGIQLLVVSVYGRIVTWRGQRCRLPGIAGNRQ